MSVLVSCGEGCGKSYMPPAELTVRLCNQNESVAYHFDCPKCSRTTIKAADRRTFDLLASAGSSVVRWDLPSEVLERVSDAPLLTDNDSISLHEALEQPDWFEAMSAGLDGHQS